MTTRAPAKEASFATAYEDGVERLAAAVEEAGEQEGAWDDAVSAGLRAGLDFLAADPVLARLLLVDSLAAGDQMRDEHERSLALLAEALRPPVQLTEGESISDEILRLQAGGLVSYLSGRVLAGEAERLSDVHDLLLAYLLAFLAPRDG